jgi:exodeoxyribonuclease V gamma subunit
MTMKHSTLASGFMVIHGNQPELLKQLLVDWFKAYPLAPLENETLLVQSNGIAQWLKLGLAAHAGSTADAGCGIAAAFDMLLPSSFTWQVYRAVLGRDAVPDILPFDKPLLIWRLMRLLPTLVHQAGYEPLAAFLQDDIELRKRHQLAEKIADLFDQYQVFRADWLDAWSQGRDVLPDLHGQTHALMPTQRWQALLWRALLADAGQDSQTSRAVVHQQFLHRMAKLPTRPALLPRRVSVFGLSSLPSQTLEVLRAIARFSQVLLCVHNPCQHYWADLLSAQDLARRTSGRHARKPGMPAQMTDEALHLHAHPLLAAWGKQGRDYIRFVDEADQPGDYQPRFAALGHRIDLFQSPVVSDRPSLLNQLQEDILQLRSVHETRAQWPEVQPAQDRSLRFHVVHSIQREVEVLHDQLLAAFNADDSLRPRDVIVMVPDVNQYAPHIEAVFGQIPTTDARYIPFSITDRAQRHQAPVVFALEFLLNLPSSRLTVSEVMDLLDVRAVRERFGIDADSLPLLRRWIQQAHIRWGLNAQHRQPFMENAGDQNTWQHGLRQMLLGYAVGGDPTQRTDQDWHDIEPLAEVAGLEAELVGPLARLLHALETLVETLSSPATPTVWGERLQSLLSDFLDTNAPDDAALVIKLHDSLHTWLQACAVAQLDEALPLGVVRDHWLAQVDQPQLAQRFMAGQLTFATLMPMRAIPFRMVCLLGMADGEFPRARPPLDFDLMARELRPGDRSRREDDRYLFLEALLSARERLHISWVGKSIQDNTDRPACVLVNQLRDHLTSGWRLANSTDPAALVRSLTIEHKLQAFSPDYFGTSPDTHALFTYAREWERSTPLPVTHATTQAFTPLSMPVLDQPISLSQLAEFLKHPVKTFYRERLRIALDIDDVTSQDQEPFALDALNQWVLQEALIQVRQDAWWRGEDEMQAVERQLARFQRRGELPLGAMAALTQQQLTAPLDEMLTQYREALHAWPGTLEDEVFDQTLDVQGQSIRVQGLITHRHGTHAQWQRIELNASSLLSKDQHYRLDKVLHAWVQHLAAHVNGHQVASQVVGKNGSVPIRPLDPAWARQQFHALVAAYLQGLCQPLPLAVNTGFAWLAKDGQRTQGPLDACTHKAVSHARSQYEPGYFSEGEAQRSPYLLRTYPSFEALWSDGAFTQWCETLYAPLRGSVGAGKGVE